MTRILDRTDSFARRHLGPRERDVPLMLQALGADSLDALIERVVPATVRSEFEMALPPARGEQEILADLRAFADRNQVFRSYIGTGYHGTVTPPAILRNVFENPGWYTQYTPYQAEISQGRMEALFNFQTMVLDLTGMEVANSSMLDEATAAAEAMTMARRVLGKKGEGRDTFLVASHCHPQTIEVVQSRAEPLGIQVTIADHSSFEFTDKVFGVLVQYPATDGSIHEFEAMVQSAHTAGALAVVAADPLSLTLLKPPGEFGADIVIGSTQRFGVPLGYGGPHAAYMAARDDYKRQMPGRIVGQSIDADGKPALRLALQTREQHIRRDRATSNICTAQVLLAVMASTYGVYHGPEGLTRIARRVHGLTGALALGLARAGHDVMTECYFDTLKVAPKEMSASEIIESARAERINLRDFKDGTIGITLDETVDPGDVIELLGLFGCESSDVESLADELADYPDSCRRTSEFMTHPVFRLYRSETELLRYLNRLQSRDLSLTTSMIPLGSCTMKLNAAVEMIPVSWDSFSDMHPFVPQDQAEGYAAMHDQLAEWLCEITGFASCSLQPNAGSQGEYAGLLVIRAHHLANGQEQRDVCLIPSSAHGTNPASATMAGMRVVVVACDDAGNIDMSDLRAKAEQHADSLGALMVTYPSTHGVFEATIREVCSIIHEHGGQVYLDGANLNAMVGVCRPGDFGADVCHLNLHKTFAIPHGGGGPGMGPICCVDHLAPYLPTHPVIPTGGDKAIAAISAAPWGSPSILIISHAYIAGMGPDGLTRATKVAILNANYIARRLKDHFPVLYTGQNDCVAHECILDIRPLEKTAGILVADVAKRLMDYGFHAPTMSFPVAGTLMVEPTESESKEEIDRFCEAMISIREEIGEIEQGHADREDNVLKNAPHTASAACSDDWNRPYSRDKACFPAPWTRDYKYWPPVARVNDVYGDRNLVCSCPPIEDYEAD